MRSARAGTGTGGRYDRAGVNCRRKAHARHRGAVRAFHPSEQTIANVLAVPHAAIGFLFRHPWLAFLLQGACFLLFGVTSVNLFVLLLSNINLFIEYGVMVIEDGALQQLAELVGLACLSGLFYVGFAVCDRTLLRRITGAPLRECRLRAGSGRMRAGAR